MKAMILAAGDGRRLRPLTLRIPKCMVPVDGKPILEHTIERFVSSGISEIIINVSHLGEQVTDHFGDGSDWGAKIAYSIEERPLGTAGGVKAASWFFGDDPFIVWYGDNLSKCDLRRLCAFHRAKGGMATICLHQREDVSQSGVVALDGDRRILRFREKPPQEDAFSHWVNAGIYVLEPRILDHVPAQGLPDFGRDIFPELLAKRERLLGYQLSSDEGLRWFDRPEDLQRTQPRTRTNT